MEQQASQTFPLIWSNMGPTNVHYRARWCDRVTEVQRKGDCGKWSPSGSICCRVRQWEQQPPELLLYVQLNSYRKRFLCLQQELNYEKQICQLVLLINNFLHFYKLQFAMGNWEAGGRKIFFSFWLFLKIALLMPYWNFTFSIWFPKTFTSWRMYW